ncbi:MAG: response regulator [Planctomycetes bacterium]|nr:response regulator [Planctomycetota bacterium]
MKKLLVVDDSSVVRGIVLRVLREAGLDHDGIVEAASGVEALRKIGHDPSIGLVLSDVHMPGMNGIDFVRALRERRTKEELPVLLLTSGDAQTLCAAALADGANGWISKPFTSAMVRAAVEPWLTRSDR